MSRKTKEEAEKTRTRILASALALFSKKGYETTTFTDIASRLKLTKGAIYWHFESKEALLTELVRLALEKFHRKVEELMPKGELTYPAVAKMMVANAETVVADPKAAAFFRLIKCQIRWAEASAAKLRRGLMDNLQLGPKEALKQALENDIAAKRIRGAVNPEEVATVTLALWDGIVQARIDHFLMCDMATTLTHAYDSIWQRIKL